MIEAVNSVLSNVSASRGVAEQQSTARSLSANPDKTQEVAKTPYVSPYISIDRQSSRAVLQIRDSDTGDVVRQFPTEGQLKAYRTAQEFSERQKAQADAELRQASGSIQTQPQTTEVLVADAPRASAPTQNTSAPTTSVQTEA